MSNYLKPREKFIKKGGDTLSDIELLAIILQIGNKKYSVNIMSQILIEKYGGLNNLINTPLEDLMSNDGIGISKAIKIKSLYYIFQKVKEKDNLISFTKTQDVYDYMCNIEEKEEENFYIICLNNNNEFLGHRHLFKGNINSVMVSPREIFKEALFLNSNKICLVHNHPSGNIYPSTADIKVTKTLLKASNFIGIKIIDHVIIGKGKYFSFVENDIIDFHP